MLLSDILAVLEGLAPTDLAEEWDNPGLQVGDPAAEVRRIGLALDPTPATVAAALEQHCQLLLTHHPLLFKPVKTIRLHQGVGAMIGAAVKGGLAMACAHTNWDAAAGGVADALADRLGLVDRRPLASLDRRFLKLVVFVPAGYEAPVRRALFAAGAGGIGDYDHCRFTIGGEGGFRAPGAAAPFIGQAGRETRTREVRLEVILPEALAEAAAAAVFQHHPYEEPAFEFYPVTLKGRGQGLGLLGRLEPAGDLLARCGREMAPAGLKVAGPLLPRVERVALLPGSGGGYVDLARQAGAEALVTGDVSYHQALRAEELGLMLVDAGHFETEWPGVPRLAERLAPRLEPGVECLVLPQARSWRYTGVLS